MTRKRTEAARTVSTNKAERRRQRIAPASRVQHGGAKQDPGLWADADRPDSTGWAPRRDGMDVRGRAPVTRSRMRIQTPVPAGGAGWPGVRLVFQHLPPQTARNPPDAPRTAQRGGANADELRDQRRHAQDDVGCRSVWCHHRSTTGSVRGHITNQGRLSAARGPLVHHEPG